MGEDRERSGGGAQLCTWRVTAHTAHAFFFSSRMSFISPTSSARRSRLERIALPLLGTSLFLVFLAPPRIPLIHTMPTFDLSISHHGRLCTSSVCLAVGWQLSQSIFIPLHIIHLRAFVSHHFLTHPPLQLLHLTWAQTAEDLGAPSFLTRFLKNDGGAFGEKSRRFRRDSRDSPRHSLVAIDLLSKNKRGSKKEKTNKKSSNKR